MKRITYILMTIALVASCTKTEIRYDEPNRISFTPVAKVSTKAAVEGTYPTTLPLYVYANAGAANAEIETYTTAYFEEFEFTHNGSAFTNADAYWPNEKHLVFAGVSASGNIGADSDKATLSMNFATNQLTVTSYTQPDNDNNDLMWFPKTSQSYGKETDEVAVQMLHACALLKFNFIAETGTAGWKIKSVVVNDLQKSGTAVCGATSATWTPSGNKSTFRVYTKADSDDASKYTIKADDSNAETDDYITPETVANNTIVIPQEPTTLSVTYEFTTSADETLEETVTVPLSLGKETVEGEEVEKKWQSGHRYTYNITMGAAQIKIAPTASSWGDYDADTATEGTQNIEKTVN